MRPNHGHGRGSNTDAQRILDAAVLALEQGAAGRWIEPPAVQSFREQLMHKVWSALEAPSWQADWRRERVYVLAYAEAMGRRAARLAAEERRAVITQQDIVVAAAKLRGYMPIAGRWCPL